MEVLMGHNWSPKVTCIKGRPPLRRRPPRSGKGRTATSARILERYSSRPWKNFSSVKTEMAPAPVVSESALSSPDQVPLVAALVGDLKRDLVNAQQAQQNATVLVVQLNFKIMVLTMTVVHTLSLMLVTILQMDVVL